MCAAIHPHHVTRQQRFTRQVKPQPNTNAQQVPVERDSENPPSIQSYLMQYEMHSHASAVHQTWIKLYQVREASTTQRDKVYRDERRTTSVYLTPS